MAQPPRAGASPRKSSCPRWRIRPVLWHKIGTHRALAEGFPIVLWNSSPQERLPVALLPRWERASLGQRVSFVVPWVFRSGDPGKGVQRKARSNGRIPWDKIQSFRS